MIVDRGRKIEEFKILTLDLTLILYRNPRMQSPGYDNEQTFPFQNFEKIPNIQFFILSRKPNKKR